ncbi:PREDICTED: mRNA-capping enzyme-like [Camelina sativa]|uniref:mRNA guanylyltransferase n=1 Tax=Camelina sativa TaxID=90675 RepID=A0ABM0Y3W6_CAMSA|nr:PREDICTED: mRNA-capping enzyme-like [Camelina sativa]
MYLNASPRPEEDDDPFNKRRLEDRIESAVEIARREREERRKRMRFDRPTRNSQPVFRDQSYHNRDTRVYDQTKIPQGWLDCPGFGLEIGCIIPSKVPLSESYNEHVPPGKRYSFKQVVRNQRINGRKLGLVIDLTNTTRYYPTLELKKDGIKHVKIACRGRDAVPDNVSVNNFVNEVLVSSVQDDDDDGEDGEAPPGTVQEIDQEYVKMSNDDILGDEIPDCQADAYRQFCYKMLYTEEEELKKIIGKKGFTQFPGSHPVSLDRESLQFLRQRYYYATWKADGTRYMMLLTIDGCYLIDRSFNFRRVQMRFPRKHSSEGISDKVHHYTLLDGEMVIDNPKGDQEGQARRRYLVYDLAALNGESVVKRTFCERWNMLMKEVIAPRDGERGISRNCYRYDLEPFGVRMKGFWLLSTVEKLLKVTIPSLSHESDGLIFQRRDDPYVPRTHEGLLKWKYAEMNSLDFLFEMDETDGRRMLFLHEKGKKKLMEGYSVEFRDDDSNPATYSGKILECRWDSENQVWVYMRIRMDKPTPNDIETARKVIKSKYNRQHHRGSAASRNKRDHSSPNVRRPYRN